MLIYLMQFKFDTANEVESIGWQMVQDRQKSNGKVLTVLPWNTKRPTRAGYHFETHGHYRSSIEAPGERFYDFVVYNHPRIKAGYTLCLIGPNGEVIAEPLPPAPVAPMEPDLSELSPSAAAVEWLKRYPGHTHEEAAAIFGIKRASVSQAVMRAKAKAADSSKS